MSRTTLTCARKLQLKLQTINNIKQNDKSILIQHVCGKICMVQLFLKNGSSTILTVSIGRLFQISITLLAKQYKVTSYKYVL